jgi:hypothetical protein
MRSPLGCVDWDTVDAVVRWMATLVSGNLAGNFFKRRILPKSANSAKRTGSNREFCDHAQPGTIVAVIDSL